MKKNKINKPPKKSFVPLDAEEKGLMESIDNDEWTSIKDVDNIIAETHAEFSQSHKKTRSIHLRLSDHDYKGVKAISTEEGIPYQTLLTSLIHKFVAKRIGENGVRHQTLGSDIGKNP
jgi:predicted DNA binding CopG/RHH family protein